MKERVVVGSWLLTILALLVAVMVHMAFTYQAGDWLNLLGMGVVATWLGVLLVVSQLPKR